MKRTPRQYARALVSVLRETKDSEQPTVIRHFLTFLRKRRMLSMLPRIVTAFTRLWAEASGHRVVAVTTVRPLSSGDLSRVTEYVQAGLGGMVSVQPSADSALQGGFLVRFDDGVCDATLRRKLDLLSAHLTN